MTKPLEVSEQTYARIQARAVPFEDTPDSAINKAYDRLEALEAQVAGMQPLDNAQLVEKVARLLGFDSAEALAEKIAEHESNLVVTDSEPELLSLWPKSALALQDHHDHVQRVVAKLLEQEAKAQKAASVHLRWHSDLTKTFSTNRRVQLPVGVKLVGQYQGNRVEAIVKSEGIEFNGEFYDNPSAAAVAAKMHLGASEKAAQTNGWTFWSFESQPGTGIFSPLYVLRERQQKQQNLDATE